MLLLVFVLCMFDCVDKFVDGKLVCLYGLFFGLFGFNVVLLLYLIEYVLDCQINVCDIIFIVFVDIFYYWMMSLFYWVWVDVQFIVQYDCLKQDCFGIYVGVLVGLVMLYVIDCDVMLDCFKCFFVGWLLQQVCNVEGLQMLLQDFFCILVWVVEFVVEWMCLLNEVYLWLGGLVQMVLFGCIVVLGEFVWGVQQCFCLCIGLLDSMQFYYFLLGGEVFE